VLVIVEYDVNLYRRIFVYGYSAGLAGTRAQSGDWYGSDMTHPEQVLRGSLPLLSPPYISMGISYCIAVVLKEGHMALDGATSNF
jgi:hypothetical protein